MQTGWGVQKLSPFVKNGRCTRNGSVSKTEKIQRPLGLKLWPPTVPYFCKRQRSWIADFLFQYMYKLILLLHLQLLGWTTRSHNIKFYFQTPSLKMASKTGQDQTDALGFGLPTFFKRFNDDVKIEDVEEEDDIQDKEVQLSYFLYVGCSELNIFPIELHSNSTLFGWLRVHFRVWQGFQILF